MKSALAICTLSLHCINGQILKGKPLLKAAAQQDPFYAGFCSADKIKFPGYDAASQRQEGFASSLWKGFNGSGSCVGGTQKSMFVGENGKFSDAIHNCSDDPTSLSIDLSVLGENDRYDCPGYQLEDCEFKMRDVVSIEAEVSIKGCGKAWACPFWVSPTPWKAPQGSSGEIDFVEVCHEGQASNNFGFEGNNKSWPTDVANPEKGFTGKIVMSINQSNGDASVTLELANSSTLLQGAAYGGYVSSGPVGKNSEGTPHGDLPYHIVTDIWNATPVGGCPLGYSINGETAEQTKARKMASQCKQTIKNVKINFKAGKEFAKDHKCYALNGENAKNNKKKAFFG